MDTYPIETHMAALLAGIPDAVREAGPGHGIPDSIEVKHPDAGVNVVVLDFDAWRAEYREDRDATYIVETYRTDYAWFTRSFVTCAPDDAAAVAERVAAHAPSPQATERERTCSQKGREGFACNAATDHEAAHTAYSGNGRIAALWLR